MISRLAMIAGHHPATGRLARFQFLAKVRRILDRIRTPRRRALVVLSLLLGCVWLGQAVVGIFLRAPADPQRIRLWIPAAMAMYSLWHLVKTLTRSPEQPFDWTPAEQELMHGGPFSRRQLIFFRFRSILMAAVAKAACFSLVMIPDVPTIAGAFAGMLGGLMLVDCIRLWFEITFDAMTVRERWLCRGGLLGPVFGLMGYAVIGCLANASMAVTPAQLPIVLAGQLSATIVGLLEAHPLSLLLVPFQPFANVVFWENTALLSLLAAIGTLVVAGAVLVITDQFAQQRKWQQERQNWQRTTARVATNTTAAADDSRRRATRSRRWRLTLGGAAPIARRQLLGAWHHRDAVAFALLVPTLLCCVPLFAQAENLWMLMNIVGSLIFYTFLLLPSGLILDFRRDIDRIAVLKSLPITPWALTVGQLATPVLLASLFQAIVLSVAAGAGAITVVQAAASVVLLLPFNVLNFSFENYLFMLSPYRRSEEGIMVFVRTILTFTAKGIIFGIAAAITIAWAIVAMRTGPMLISQDWAGPLLFGVGIWTLVAATAYATTRLLSRRVATFDITQDAPAIS